MVGSQGYDPHASRPLLFMAADLQSAEGKGTRVQKFDNIEVSSHDFKDVDPPAFELVVLVPPPGFDPGSADFQSAAFTRLA